MAHVLHVDDTADWRRIVAELLEEAGHTVVSCSTMDAAREAYDKGKLDLVIVDGSVDQPDDGISWTIDLHILCRQKVLSLTGMLRTRATWPQMAKWNFKPRALLDMLNG